MPGSTAMQGFPGFPDGKQRLTPVPNLFFSDLLPAIDNLVELKVTLYAFWALGQREGEVRYLRLPDFMNDPVLLKACLLYTSPSPRDRTRSRMPSSA